MSSTACIHSDELLTLGAMHLLSAADQALLAERLNTCPACRERWKDYQGLVAAMPRLVMAETASSTAINGKTAPSLNGKTPHIAPLLKSHRDGQEGEASNDRGSAQPVIALPGGREANHRLMNIMSGLAAVVLLAGLIGGFWLLALGRSHGTVFQNIQAKPTASSKNPCYHPGAHKTGQPTCAIIVMDYSTTPETLVALDSTTGRPLPSLRPLQVGNALLAAISADQRTLALAVTPNVDDSSNSQHVPYIQIVSLDSWRLGPKMLVGDHIQALAMTRDGTHIYAVSGTSDHSSASQTFLHYYTYDPGTSFWSHPWKESLPILPDNQSSFALSADGNTAYIFSAAVHTPELVAVSLKADGITIAKPLQLPSIAPGGAPPIGQNDTYKPGDSFLNFYNPAVIFAPDQNRLYIVHAEAANTGQDVIGIIDLTKMAWLQQDILITDSGHAQADISGIASTSVSPLSSAMVGSAEVTTPGMVTPQLALQPATQVWPYYGRDEQGTISPDGHWLYLSGISKKPIPGPNGTTVEQYTNLGLWKVDIQTGQITNRWFIGNSYNALTISQDGKMLYLFGPPNTSNPNISGLFIFSTVRNTAVNWLSNINSGIFIVLLN